MRIGILFALFALGGCSTAGVASRAALMSIEPNTTRAELIGKLGEPGARTFRENVEAVQYCRTGIDTDEYTTFWIVDGVVKATSTENSAIAVIGSCGQRYPDMDWSKAPREVRLLLE